MQEQAQAARGVDYLSRVPMFISEQRSLIGTLTAFILIGTLFLPNPMLLTVPVIAQFLITIVLPIVYAVVAHIFYQYFRTGSLDGALDYAFKSILVPQNLKRAIPTIVILAAFMMTFPSFKANIPDFNPYAWDLYFSRLDQLLHFGIAPWRLLDAITGYGMSTVLLDKLYYLWFPVVFMAVGVAITIPGTNAVRDRFMISFAASWIIIGVLCAIMFSSVGPIFYDRLYENRSDYAVLIENLQRVNTAIPLNTLLVQEGLWHLYVTNTDAIISGISAMPSMHNAICVLIFLAARHIHRYLAIAACAYAILIFLGSVHLGWHYAVDGYASAIIVAIIWKAAGWRVRTPSVGFFGRSA